MRKYLIYAERNKERTGAWVEIPSEWSSDQYGELQEEFSQKYGPKRPTHPTEKYATMDMFDEKTENGTRFSWNLAGPNGASFLLLWLPENTKEQLEEAAKEIRRKRDAVSVHYLKINELVEHPISTLSKEV